MGTVRGKAVVDESTKNLALRVKTGEIAVINHLDLDSVAAMQLVEKAVGGVINARPSITGNIPVEGALILLSAGIPVLDNVGSQVFGRIRENDLLEIKGNTILCNGNILACGERLLKSVVQERYRQARDKFSAKTVDFVKNTMAYAARELPVFFGSLTLPLLPVNLAGRQVLMVARGKGYREDLKACLRYIRHVRPVLMGIDGGADALAELGLKPDIIIGDMDSVSDKTLLFGSFLLVHAYTNGCAPGQERLISLGLKNFNLFPCPGTSEDAAMLLAHAAGAELVVAVGTHSNPVDFLEKGRQGMASTFLVRLKVGSILVDARGINKLYQRANPVAHLVRIAPAAFFPLLVMVMLLPVTRQYMHLVLFQLKLFWGGS